MILPDVLEQFRHEAAKLVAEGKAEEIIFSGATYQIHITENTKEPVWVFLQLDPEDGVKDLFCNCTQCAATGSCVHMAMGLLAVFKSYPHPLHKRFEASPFYPIFTALSRASTEFSCRQHGHSLWWGSEDCYVVLKGSSERMRRVEELASARVEETEETSIKFSNLTDEELQGWRQGVVSDRLQFELSCHSDLAKYLFMYSEESPCKFQFEDGLIPNRCFCDFEDLSCVFPILGNFSTILETLPFQRTTPLIEKYGGRSVRSVTFDPQEQVCRVAFEGKEIDVSSALSIPDSEWMYIPGKAFVKKGGKKSRTIRSKEEIASFLDDQNPSAEILPLFYHIEVEVEKGLTITPFHKTPFDLKDAFFFGHWLWNQELGFRRIQPLHFNESVFNVSLDELSDFLTSHRYLLSSIPGFSVHEHPPREKITFTVDTSAAVIFSREIMVEPEASFKELKEWVFVEGEGFFVKDGRSHIPYDTPIPPHHVAEFIRKETEWLKEVPGFFAPSTPISGVGLEIRLVKKRIDIEPVYQWDQPEFQLRALFYDDMGFVPGLGFFYLPTLLAQHNCTRTYFAKDREQWDRFFLEQLPDLQKAYPCSIDSRLLPPSDLKLICHGVEPQAIETAVHLPSLFEASFYWESEKGRISPDELVTAYRRGERFLPTKAGLIDLTDERFGWLSSVGAPRAGMPYHLKAFDFLKIRAHDEFSFAPQVVPATSSLIHRLLNAEPPHPPDLSKLRSHLRPYQAHGVLWLWFLYVSGLSGLLCDDMGVGKTHQAMGLLSAVYSAFPETKKPIFLIICPTSLLWHWKDKLADALPHFRIFPYIGGGRVLEEFHKGYDVFLTTYGIWRNEAKVLHGLSFEVAIFDELQIAKNHVSQIWTALSQVRSHMRLGLTGTPIENQLRELKSVFDLVLPGYLPHESLFREYYMRPIEREGASDRRNLLSRYVRPFLLRRRKQDVLPDLPPKTEDVYLTELIGEQKELYRQIASRQAVPLIQQLHDEQLPIPYMHIFALLSALKQVCNHPAAYLRDVENYTRYDSGKWDAFLELIEEAKESGQKVVVFSQFLSMLDIMERYFHLQQIDYAQIRGSTKDRGREILRFQQDPSCQVFLGSLQAAGLGIDLTAGSVVIHYDRWWNAARENQATDRVHRIGQSRGVMVYKLMTAKTIEERIDRMIARKAQLFEDVIAYDDHQIVKKLDRSELLELLQGLESLE